MATCRTNCVRNLSARTSTPLNLVLDAMATARCSCGALTAETTDSPYVTVICHCSECRKRTGSILGVGVYFERGKVTIQGEANGYTRTIEDRKFTSHFCPTCGTSLYWTTELHPDGIGIGVGCFDDPLEFLPDRSVWEENIPDWLSLETIPGHVQGGRSEQTRGGI